MKEELIIEPVYAYKIFRVKRDYHSVKTTFRLTGIGVGDKYTYDKGLNIANNEVMDEVRDRYKLPKSPSFPSFKGKEGFYSYKYIVDFLKVADFIAYIIEIMPSLDERIFEQTLEPTIFYYIGGIVELKGRIVEHERGYRSEYLTIKKILIFYLDSAKHFFFGNPFKIYARQTNNISLRVHMQGYPEALDTPVEIEQRKGDYEEMYIVKRELELNYGVEVVNYRNYLRDKINPNLKFK